ncbi:hypothetical protein PXW77_26080, partial [Klebsiella quasipneumoniae subsp. similipneumoniae]|uniref:hypothetical protein n=1 Tax=Klebsiella quasipneumoniae TaxID=1463165 RepID=UPI0023804D20
QGDVFILAERLPLAGFNNRKITLINLNMPPSIVRQIIIIWLCRKGKENSEEGRSDDISGPVIRLPFALIIGRYYCG